MMRAVPPVRERLAVMRVLFVAFPWRTHFWFCVPMAWALRSAGHEVHVASSREFTVNVTEAGLTAVPVGSKEPVLQRAYREQKEAFGDGKGTVDPIDLGENREELLPWSYLKSLCSGAVARSRIVNDAMIDDLVAYCRWWKPDLVVWEWLTNAGAVAASAVGAAHARMPIGLGLDVRLRRHFLKVMARQDPADREDPAREWLGGWGEKYGFDFSEQLLTGQFTIDQWPDSMRLETGVPHVSTRYVPYNGRAPYSGRSLVPDWVHHEGRAPRVLATFGTSMWDMTRPLLSSAQLQKMLDSVAGLDIELVLTLPARIQKELERVPRNTRLVEFVPLHAIISSCSAVIHHGGLPTFCSSLAHGLPQLMVSRSTPDAALRGARLEKAQAGQWLPPHRTTGKEIGAYLVRMLEEPSFRSGAERLRQDVLAQPSPNELVPELERLTAEYRSA